MSSCVSSGNLAVSEETLMFSHLQEDDSSLPLLLGSLSALTKLKEKSKALCTLKWILPLKVSEKALGQRAIP